MTHRYFPPGYCGHERLVQLAYFHLFPAPLRDSELIEASLRYLSFEEDLEHQLRRLDAPSIPREKEREMRKEVGTLVTEIQLCKFVNSAIESDTYDPVLSLFPPFPEFEFVGFEPRTKPDWSLHQGPPHHIIQIGYERFNRMADLVRDRLFTGDIVCYLAHPESGLVAVKDKNFWLNNDIVGALLLSGKIEAKGTGIMFDMMYEVSNLESAFPAFGSASIDEVPPESSVSGKQQERGAKPSKQEKAESWLAETFGSTRPDKSIHDLQKLYAEQTGESIGRTYMVDARIAAWPDQKDAKR